MSKAAFLSYPVFSYIPLSMVQISSLGTYFPLFLLLVSTVFPHSRLLSLKNVALTLCFSLSSSPYKPLQMNYKLLLLIRFLGEIRINGSRWDLKDWGGGGRGGENGFLWLDINTFLYVNITFFTFSFWSRGHHFSFFFFHPVCTFEQGRTLRNMV